MLLVLCATNLGFSYQISLGAFALKQIQAGLAVGDEQVGNMAALIRAGALLAVLATVMADRVGRRRMLLVSIAGFSILSLASGFARGFWDYTLYQSAARIFLSTCHLVSVVMLAEELRPGQRGWAIGVFQSLGSLGGALSLAGFAAIDVLPGGWRSLYWIGALPLVAMPWFVRNLNETRRFAEQDVERADSHALQPMVNLLRMYPGRLLLFLAALVPIFLILDTVLFFIPKLLQEDHGLSPPLVALVFGLAGAMTPVGNLVGGGLADRIGRRPLLAISCALSFGAFGAMFHVSGLWIMPLFGLAMLGAGVIFVLVHAFGTELFPTSYRSTAGGARETMAVVGGSLGLWAAGVLFGVTGSYASALTWLLVLGPIPVLVAFLLPETAGRELEEVSGERGSGTLG